MPTVKPPVEIDLAWQGGLRFEGASGDRTLVVDGEGDVAITPMQMLGLSLASCMAIDVVHVLQRMRTPPEAVTARLSGIRADDNPRRFVTIELEYRIRGDVPDANVERAIRISRDTYCSVWQTFRQDIDFTTRFRIDDGGEGDGAEEP